MQATTFLCTTTRAVISVLMLAAIMVFSTALTTHAEERQADITLKVIGGSAEVALHKTIEIEIENLDLWVKKGLDPSKFVLVIDGNELQGLTPFLIGNGKKLQFDLKRVIDVNEDMWDAILSRKNRGFTFDRPVPITVNFYDGKNDVAVDGEYSAKLIIVKKRWLFAFAVVFAAAIFGFILMARRSDMLRGPGEQPKGLNGKGQPNRKRYSLARSQMAFWFFTIIISYVFIWMVTDDLSSITASVLGLMGISAATGLGSAAVDSSKQVERDSTTRAEEEKQKTNELELENLKSHLTALAKSAGKAHVADINAQRVIMENSLVATKKTVEQSARKIQELTEAAQPQASKHFLTDILSDDDGLSFHRFQMFSWTIVLIIVFLSQVYRVLAMPDFDATLLALMGISSGTYIGFKLPQKQG